MPQLIQGYFLGGGNCSGKTTLAKKLAQEEDLTYFSLDDHLSHFMEQLVADKNPLAIKIVSYSPDETWLRDPLLQRDEALALYEEMFSLIKKELLALPKEKPFIAEGAGFLPTLLFKENIS